MAWSCASWSGIAWSRPACAAFPSPEPPLRRSRATTGRRSTGLHCPRCGRPEPVFVLQRNLCTACPQVSGTHPDRIVNPGSWLRLGGPAHAPSRRCAEPSQVAALVISTGMKGSWQQCDCFAIAPMQHCRTIARGNRRAAKPRASPAASIHARVGAIRDLA